MGIDPGEACQSLGWRIASGNHRALLMTSFRHYGEGQFEGRFKIDLLIFTENSSNWTLDDMGERKGFFVDCFVPRGCCKSECTERKTVCSVL